MARYEVETDLLVHCRVKITVEADGADDAIDIATGHLPQNHDRNTQRGWKANCDIVAPKGVDLQFVKATYFEQASGSERAKKIG